MIRKIIRRTRDRLLLTDSEYLHRLTPHLSLIPISETTADDVFIAGYPKSGNTWMQQLVAGLLYGIDTQFLPDKLSQALVPDVHARTYYTRFLDICCFKTHHLPKPAYRRVIHLVRDGRDVMASYYAYLQNLNKPFDLKEVIVNGKGLFPSMWDEHCRQWLDNPYSAEILQVRYEDLLDKTHAQMSRISRFMGLERDDELIARVIAGCTLKEMQHKEKTYGMASNKWPKDKSFIRKGQVGGYVNEIPLELVEFFEEQAGEYLQHFGYPL